MDLRKLVALLSLIPLCHCFHLEATEYFVAKNGNDRNEGVTEDQAFATIGKGVSVLAPGDVLTIGPGEYFESVVSSISGDADAPITIRAKRAHTAIVRGDLPLTTKFEKTADRHFVYECDWDGEIRGVLDSGFLRHYAMATSIDAADRAPGSYLHDAEKGTLYVHTADSSSPDKHVLSLAGVAGAYGLRIDNSAEKRRHGVPDENEWTRNVIVEGLVFRGFSRSIPEQTRREGAGLSVLFPRNCVIRNCVAFLSATGLEFAGPKSSRDEETALAAPKSEHCLIENCRGYGIEDDGSGAAIICRGSITDSIIRDCVAFNSKKCIRFYQGVIAGCEMRHNIAFSSGDIWEKGNFRPEPNRILGNVFNIGSIYGRDDEVKGNVATSLSGPRHFSDAVLAENIVTSQSAPIDLAANFAAPEHLDYRLQSDSSFRGSGRAPYPYEETVFFVKPDGDDGAAGTSVTQAWKTLAKACRTAEAGHTVYILAGTYDETLAPENSGTEQKPIVFSGRGDGRAVIKGIELNNSSSVVVRDLTVLKGDGPGATIVDSENVTLERCVLANRGAAGVHAEKAVELTVRHCALPGNAAGLELLKCRNAEIAANIFADDAETAFRLDFDSLLTLWSDYNSFDDADQCYVVVDGASAEPYGLDAWRRSFRLDEHSPTRVPEFDELFHLKNSFRFNGLGPLGMPIGPYARVARSGSAAVEEPVVRSTTSTTVDIECVTPGAQSNCELRWGITPECENCLRFENEYLRPYVKDLFHYFSLAGLTPGQHYFYKIVASAPPRFVFSNEPPREGDENKIEASTGTRCFITPLADPPPRIFHVSPDGDDENNGLSWKKALRTINAAVGKTKAGDTVIVGDGEYHENVVVKATGDENAPIVIKALNPGKAVLDGDGRIKSAFELIHKHWITLDGFYVANYAANTRKYVAGVIDIVDGSDHTVRRCVLDGRPRAPFCNLVAKCCVDLTIENCVFRNAWLEALCYNCPNVVVKNNVFYGNMVGCLVFNNKANEKALLSHNVILGQVPKKRANAVVKTTDIACLVDERNCYFTRIPEDEKKLYVTDKPKPEKITFAEFKKRTGQGATSFFANPGMPIIKEYEIYQGDMTGRPHKFVTQEMNWRIVTVDGAKKRVPEIALFEEFFAGNPKCAEADDGQPIGLDPEAFSEKRESESDASGDDEYPRENRNEPEEAP